jgi:hypothetical protein
MLSCMVDFGSLTDAEPRVIDAVKTGAACDVTESGDVQPEEMTGWGAERTIRTAVLIDCTQGVLEPSSPLRSGVD